MGNDCCSNSEMNHKYQSKEPDGFKFSKDPIFRKHQLSKNNYFNSF